MPLTFSVGGLSRIPVSEAHFAGAPFEIVISHCPFSRITGEPTPPGEVVVTSMIDPCGNASVNRFAMVEAYTYAVVPTSCVANEI